VKDARPIRVPRFKAADFVVGTIPAEPETYWSASRQRWEQDASVACDQPTQRYADGTTRQERMAGLRRQAERSLPYDTALMKARTARACGEHEVAVAPEEYEAVATEALSQCRFVSPLADGAQELELLGIRLTIQSGMASLRPEMLVQVVPPPRRYPLGGDDD